MNIEVQNIKSRWTENEIGLLRKREKFEKHYNYLINKNI